jgi:thioredoxin-like negative regulator of GroEL
VIVLGREDIADMLKMARQLAAKGHRLQMIETMLAANRFDGVASFLDQPHVQDELKDIADRSGWQGATRDDTPDTSWD